MRHAEILIFTALASMTGVLRAESLTLEGYIDAVKTHNGKATGAHQALDGAQSRSGEWRLMYLPTLTAGVESSNDKRKDGQYNPLGTVEHTAFGWNLGLNEQTSFGMNARWTLREGRNKYDGVNPALLPIAEYSNGGWTLELTQSLWRNGFGSETKAMEELQRVDAESKIYEESLNLKMLVAEAESAYYRLAIAREVLQYQQEILNRAKSIRSWSSKRANLKLADVSDLYQAEAAVAGRELEQRLAQDEVLAASRAFNKLQGVLSDEVGQELTPASSENLVQKVEMRLELEREDLKLQEVQTRVSKAKAKLNEEKNKSTLDVYATYGTSGLETDVGKAMSESLGTKYPYQAIGVRFSTPLAFGLASDVRQGYRAEQMAQEAKYKQMKLEYERGRQDTQAQLEQARGRLKLVENLEKAQQSKLKHEKGRLDRGRSTTYQVLLFEQDFLNSQLTLARTKQEILSLLAQLKTYGDLK